MKRKAVKAHKVENENNSFITGVIDKTLELRSEDTEFYGLQRELIYLKQRMISDYELSKDIKHPRDIGRARELIVEDFLVGTGLIPEKYGISKNSARVASVSGHCSKEMDIVLYNKFENIYLMKRSTAIEYYPRETVYGSIQVKSRLGKDEIKDSFLNISSYKMLYNGIPSYSGSYSDRMPSTKGFGIIFAYDSDLEWSELVTEIEKQSELHEKTRWPNVIFILKKGFFMFGDGRMASAYSEDVEGFENPKIHGYPDRDGSNLFALYSIIISLLENTKSNPLKIENYYNLPYTSGELSYSFALSPFMEMLICNIHGEYIKKIPSIKLSEVVAYCRTQTSRNWIEIINEVYNRPQDEEAIRRQPGKVYVYNPENLPLKDILLSKEDSTLTYDAIVTSNMNIYIPWYYSQKYGIIEECPSCARIVQAKLRRKAKKDSKGPHSN